MSMHDAGLIGIGVVAAVLLVLYGYWLAGQPCSCADCRAGDARNHADPYGGQPEPEVSYLETEGPLTPQQAEQLQQRWVQQWAPEEKLFTSGASGLMLHKAGCIHLVRPEPVDPDEVPDETRRYCPRCWPEAA